jgi:hypothetical protein
VDLQGTWGDYFIDCASAFEVMTGWRTLLEYQAAGFFPECEGFSLNSVYGSRTEDFLRILRQGADVFAYSARVKFPNPFENSKVRSCKQEGIITIQACKLKFFIYCRKSSIPSTI